MKTPNLRLFICLSLFLFTGFPDAQASHILGGGFSYRYLGDTVINATICQKYEVTLALYQDCRNGVPDAIAEDNPAYFTVYDMKKKSFFRVDTNIRYDVANGGSIRVPVTNVNTTCGFINPKDLPTICLQQQLFKKVYYLPPSDSGYVVVYQRCCRNSSVKNILNPGDVGITFFCSILTDTATGRNNSAIFKEYPPQLIALNEPQTYDHSATDADGDSLTYELFQPLSGAQPLDIKPTIATPPPYDGVPYTTPFSYESPMPSTVPIEINTSTGAITATPTTVGKYLIGVQCNEWRNGKLINSVRREFEWDVAQLNTSTKAYRPYAGNSRIIMEGDSVHFHASGADSYQWTPADYLDNPGSPDAIGTFPAAGEYLYTLHGETNSGCAGDDDVKVVVLAHSDFIVPNAFTPNEDYKNDVLIPIARNNSTLKSLKIYNRYGNEIFAQTSSNARWDGKRNGKLQPMGVYVWLIEYTDNNGVPRTSSGNVTLLR